MFKPFRVTQEMKNRLKALVELREDDFNFKDYPRLAGLVACLGIQQEVGTINDELHRHLFDRDTGRKPALSSMRAEIITWKGRFGVRVFSTEAQTLSTNHPQLEFLIHPEFSRDEEGQLKQLVIFPQTVAEIVKLQGVQLVIVKKWALNTIFGGFDPAKNFYVTNDWEIRQNDGLRMAQLLAQGKLAFFGTHDLVAHVAGIRLRSWRGLQKLSLKLTPSMSSGDQRALTHLLIPYIMGVLLDDLAQPAHYDCYHRLNTIELLSRLQEWVVTKVPAKKHMHPFPRAFSDLIEEPRGEGFNLTRLNELIKNLSLELQIYGVQRVS